jgi:hypothetical protein
MPGRKGWRSDLAERFARFVSPEPMSGCWLWTGKIAAGRAPGKNVQRHAYGHFWLEGKTVQAHRVAFMLSNGTIPEGGVVAHSCDNPSCVNPGHLFLTTSLRNSLDMKSKGRSHKPALGEKAVKLSPSEAKHIKDVLIPSRVKQRDIADIHGVSQTLISRIKRGLVWPTV